MRVQLRTLGLILTAIMIAIGTVSPVFAQAEKAKPADTLTGEKILEKYIEASGGRDAYAKLNNQYVALKMEFMPQVFASIKTYKIRPDKVFQSLEAPQFGSIQRVYDGTTYWEKSAMTGARIVEGDELADAIREEAAFDRFSDWKNYFAKLDYTGTDTSGGMSYYRILATPLTGKPQTWLVDQKTGLITKVQLTQMTPNGEMPMEVTMSDYRNISGVLVPFKMVSVMAGMNITANVDSVAYNVAIADSLFAVPTEIQELLKKKQAEKTVPAPPTMETK